MTAPHMIDPARMLGQALSDASPDLMRHLLGTVINSLLSVDADNVCGAEYGVASPDRVNSHKRLPDRELDTRVGTIDVAIPKLRTGSYFPEWLLERRKAALTGQLQPLRAHTRPMFTSIGAAPVTSPPYPAATAAAPAPSATKELQNWARGRLPTPGEFLLFPGSTISSRTSSVTDSLRSLDAARQARRPALLAAAATTGFLLRVQTRKTLP